MRRCDKCGEHVPAENDALLLEAEAQGAELAGLFYTARHLFPTATCEGSPSRAQYFPDQPRDPRYPYVAMQEVVYRQAHARLVARHA